MVQQVMQETFCAHLHQADAARVCAIIDNVDSLDREAFLALRLSGPFCCDDIDAVRILGRLKEWNAYSSEKIALVSYSHTDLPRFFAHAITSIDSYYAEMAALTAEIIQASRQGSDIFFNMSYNRTWWFGKHE